MKSYLLVCFITSSLLAGAAEKDPQSILKSSDAARGGGLPGIVWDVKVSSTENGKKQDSALTVSAVSENSLVEYTAPARMNGQKLLMTGKNMWFSQPGLQRAVPISPRQKLSGQAANGDIAATNYAADYNATIEREESCGQEQCVVLRLKAANKGVTYNQILYWVSERKNLGVKAEFYSVSGKRFKSAILEYDNHIDFQGRQLPFVSRLTISDSLNAANITTLEYSHIKVTKLPAAQFNPDLLIR